MPPLVTTRVAALVSPPALFVGRDAEVASLRRALDRAPLAVVTGAAGIGKSSVVSVAVDKHRRASGGTVVGARLQHGQSFERFLVELVHELIRTLGIGPVPWADALRDVGALFVTLVELSEALGAVVVAEDLHHATSAQFASLAGALSRGAAASRWVLTSRRDELLPSLLEQTIRLGPLPHRTLLRLAMDLGAEPDEAAALATAAAGSPWALRHGVASALRREPALDRAQQRLEQVLRRLDIPLEVSQLERLANALASEPALSALHEAGTTEHLTSGQVRLHDVARERHAEATPPQVSHRIAEAWGDSQTPSLALEAMKNLLEAGRVADAVQWLDQRASDLMARGYAPHLWDALRDRPEDAFTRWKLEAALILGGGPALSWAVVHPEPADPEVRVLWVEALLEAGQVDRAQEALGGLPGGRPRSLLTMARAAFAGGDPETARTRAVEALEMFRASGERRLAMRARILAARACVFTGRTQEGWKHAEAARHALLAEPVETSLGDADQLTSAYMNLGRPSQVRDLAARYSSQLGNEVALLLGSRHFLPNLSTVEIEGGNLAEGRRLLGLLERSELAGRSRFVLHMNALRLAMTGGDFATAHHHLEVLRSHAVEQGQSVAYQWAMAAQALLDTLMGRKAPSSSWHPDMPRPEGGLVRAYLSALETSFALRRGDDAIETAWEPPAALRQIPDAQVVTQLARAERELLQGSAARALELTRAGLQVANEFAWGALGFECRVLVLDILTLLGDWDALGREARQLHTLATAAPSPRLVLAAGMATMISRGVVDGPTCERYAAAMDVSPRTARRARALLGQAAYLDRIDAAVVDAFQQRSTTTLRALNAPESPKDPWPAGWGIDFGGRRVHLPGLRDVALSRSPLPIKLLRTLVEHGGEATKEALVLATWDVPDYHPLRDDKRLQMAVSRLRNLLEDHPKQPTRLVTTEDGYAFGDDERVWWVTT